jgi:hypothetical protein
MVLAFVLILVTGIFSDAQMMGEYGLAVVEFKGYSEVSPVIWVPILVWQLCIMIGIGFQLYFDGEEVETGL